MSSKPISPAVILLLVLGLLIGTTAINTAPAEQPSEQPAAPPVKQDAKSPQVDPPQLKVDALMRAKLKSAQDLLRALAVEDFDALKRESQRLETLSLDTSWNIIQTKDYIKHSREFRDATRAIRGAAQKKNIDGAGLGYIRLTLTCIDCHRHMRSTKQ